MAGHGVAARRRSAPIRRRAQESRRDQQEHPSVRGVPPGAERSPAHAAAHRGRGVVSGDGDTVLDPVGSSEVAPTPTVDVRGTVVVLLGAGERADDFARLTDRLVFDGYRVELFDDVSTDIRAVRAGVERLVRDRALPRPVVLLGSDVGATLAASVAADSVAHRRAHPGLATRPRARPTGRPDPEGAADGVVPAGGTIGGAAHPGLPRRRGPGHRGRGRRRLGSPTAAGFGPPRRPGWARRAAGTRPPHGDGLDRALPRTAAQ
jgi:hypothetical protein